MGTRKMKKMLNTLHLIIDYISEMSFWEMILTAIIFNLSMVILLCLIELGRRMMALGI